MAKKRKRRKGKRTAINQSATGGLGGQEHPPGTIRDTRMVARAITERWPIKPAMRAAVVKRMAGIVTSSKVSAREATAAAKALIAADALNQADEIAAKPQQVQHAHVHAFLDAAIEQEIERITGKPATAQLEGLDGEGEGQVFATPAPGASTGPADGSQADNADPSGKPG